MSKIKEYLLCASVIWMMNVQAQNKDPNAYALMTGRDLRNNTLSNLTITNSTGQSISVAGLFIASFDINDCSSCFGAIVSGNNLGGAVISPVTFKKNQTVSIGQNYLYNMIYNGIYYIRNTVGSSPCALPGCSWPGDNINVHGWCIAINAISRHANYTFSNYTNGSNPPANSPPYSATPSSVPFDYNYALVDPNTLGTGNACFGPIVCNDQTLTCKVNTAQNQAFRAY